MSTKCECKHPMPEGRGYCQRCGYPMGPEAGRRAKADREDREKLSGPSRFDDRGEYEFNKYLGDNFHSVFGRIAKELHLQAVEVDKSSDEKVVFEAAGIKFLVKPSDIPTDVHIWREMSFLMRLFTDAAFVVFNDEANRSIPGNPYSG